MYPFAQTKIQLFDRLSREGYSETELKCILKAYQLAMSLFTLQTVATLIIASLSWQFIEKN